MSSVAGSQVEGRFELTNSGSQRRADASPAVTEDLIALTTMLERVLNPRQNLPVRIQPIGLYGLPEDLIKSTESNPAFVWRCKLLNLTIDGGKFVPRELTEEEVEAAKTKKKPDLKTKANLDQSRIQPAFTGSEEDRRIADFEDKFKNPKVQWINEDLKMKEGSLIINDSKIAHPGQQIQPQQSLKEV